MRSVETEGDTIDQAIGKALALLDVERERAEIEILEDASRGILGFGGRPARVRATVRARFAAAPNEDVARETAPAAGAPSGADGALASRATRVLEQIIAHLDAPCSITRGTAEEADSILLSLAGEGGGLLIGRRGETLDALEYLVNRIVGRDDRDSRQRIVLDVEGYRERRRASLEEMARRMAEKARQSRQPVALSPMSPRDRRTVHLALQAVDGVSTRSEGDGHYRRVVIVPGSRGSASGAGGR